MPGPQLEDGYTRIANEILDVIAQLPINATQFRILMVVWRYTYGFNRKECELSNAFISKATGIHKKQVQRELNALIKMNIIIVIKEATFSSPRILKFNKYYQNWQVANSLPANKKDTHTGSELVTSPGNKLVTSPGSELVPQEKQYKDNIKDIEEDEEDKGVPSPENTNDTNEVPSSLPDKVPSHCQDPVLTFLNKVSNYYTTLTGRLASSSDEVSITGISKLTTNFELVKQAMDQSKKNFKPKYPGDKIRSFNFFVPAIKSKIAAEEARQKSIRNERREADGEYSKGNIDKRTLEIVRNSKKEWNIPEVNF